MAQSSNPSLHKSREKNIHPSNLPPITEGLPGFDADWAKSFSMAKIWALSLLFRGQLSGTFRIDFRPCLPKKEKPPSDRRLTFRIIYLLWWSWTGSNRRPLECHSSALPTELQPQVNRSFIKDANIVCQAHLTVNIQGETQYFRWVTYSQ